MLVPILGLTAPVLLTLVGDILPKGIAILLGKQLAVRAAPVISVIQIGIGGDHH